LFLTPYCIACGWEGVLVQHIPFYKRAESLFRRRSSIYGSSATYGGLEHASPDSNEADTDLTALVADVASMSRFGGLPLRRRV
jgi:predicted metal-dependent RNase